ncbi:hypothetical protein Tco_1383172 [Tanacetum coccineum]
MKNVNDLIVPMETEDRGRASELVAGSSQATIIDSAEVGSSKRAAEAELDHEGSKRQKTNEALGSVQEQTEEEEKELSQEDLQQMIMVVPVEKFLLKPYKAEVLNLYSTYVLDSSYSACSHYQNVSKKTTRKITRIMQRTLTLLLVFTMCEQEIHLYSVLMRFMDDLLALDSIVHFGFSDQRLEQIATFSIPTSSE